MMPAPFRAPGRLALAIVAIIYNFVGADAQQVETVLSKNFLNFLDQGGGVMCLHFAIAAHRLSL
jgi:hypothetical protein